MNYNSPHGTTTSYDTAGQWLVSEPADGTAETGDRSVGYRDGYHHVRALATTSARSGRVPARQYDSIPAAVGFESGVPGLTASVVAGITRRPGPLIDTANDQKPSSVLALPFAAFGPTAVHETSNTRLPAVRIVDLTHDGVTDTR